MAKQRPPNWSRGKPRYPEGQRPIRADVSGTAGPDLFSERTVEGTLSAAPVKPGDFKPILPVGPQRGLHLSASMVSAIVAGAVALAVGVAYIVGLKGDIAVVNSIVQSLQKSQADWITEFRERIRRLEDTPPPKRSGRVPTDEGRKGQR
jgi:hypothetical protein